MDKIKTVKIKNPDGSVSEETYTISVDAKNVDMKNGKDLQDTIGDINIDRDGSINVQLKDVKEDISNINDNLNDKVSKIDIVNNLDSNNSDKPLSANMGKELKGSLEEISKKIFIDDISFDKFYDENTKTDYYILHIPHLDSNNNVIKLKRGFAKDVTSTPIANEKISDFAKRHDATLITNGGVFLNMIDPSNPDYKKMPFTVINEGEVISQVSTIPDSWQTNMNRFGILGIKENGLLKFYPYNTTSQQLLDDGVINSISTFNQVMHEGNLITNDQIANVNTYQYQFILLGQNVQTLDYYFICCDGKGSVINQGMTIASLCNILKTNYGVTEIFRLDSGGSTEVYYKGSIKNQVTDDSNLSERELVDYIYFEKELSTNISKDVVDSYEEIGRVREELNKINNTSKKYGMGYESEFAERTNYNHVITQKIGNKTMYIMMDTPNVPGGFVIYDSELQRTVFRVFSDGRIETPLLKLTDSGWLKAYNSNQTKYLLYRLYGDCLYIKGRIRDVVANTNEKFYMNGSIVNVDASNISYVAYIQGSGTTYGKIVVNTNEIELYPGSASGTFNANACFMLGDDE